MKRCKEYLKLVLNHRSSDRSVCKAYTINPLNQIQGRQVNKPRPDCFLLQEDHCPDTF